LDQETSTSTSHERGPTPSASDISSAPKAYSDVSTFRDNGDLAPVVGELKHALKAGGILQNVDEFKSDFTF
jgi:hypothetical protein